MASINEALANHKLYRLLKRIAEGDEQAVDNLYSDYGDFIYFHILNITDNKYIAEEIFQEVFINIIMLSPDKLPRFGATSWLTTVTHNTTISYLKKREIRLSSLPSLETVFESEHAMPTSSGIEDSIVSKIYIKDLLSILKKDTQQIMSLRYQGYIFNEIADELHMNPATVRSRYSRARTEIKKIMGEQNDK